MEIKPVETKVIYLSSNDVGKIHDKKMVDEQLKKTANNDLGFCCAR